MRQGIDSEYSKEELLQFERWSFGMQLAYVRESSGAKSMSSPSGLLGKSKNQDGMRDPFQDQRTDRWPRGTPGSSATAPVAPRVTGVVDQNELHRATDEEIRKRWSIPKLPQEYDLSPTRSEGPVVDLTRTAKPARGKMPRMPKNKKKTFMKSTRGHLEDLYRRIEEDYWCPSR